MKMNFSVDAEDRFGGGFIREYTLLYIIAPTASSSLPSTFKTDTAQQKTTRKPRKLRLCITAIKSSYRSRF